MKNHGETYNYDDGQRAYQGYAVRPPDEIRSAKPCVLVVHDWSGLNDGTRKAAERVATLGYVAFAIDVYGKGIRGEEAGDNSHLMNSVLADRADLRKRLLAAHEAARAMPGVDKDRIAVIGYCFGGLCALDLTRAAPLALRAAVCIHGAYQPPGLQPQPISASVLLLHGWEDPFTPPADASAIARELTDAGADWQLHAYGHAQHSFTFEGANAPERGIAYHELSARRAWKTMSEFLAEALT